MRRLTLWGRWRPGFAGAVMLGVLGWGGGCGSEGEPGSQTAPAGGAAPLAGRSGSVAGSSAPVGVPPAAPSVASAAGSPAAPRADAAGSTGSGGASKLPCAVYMALAHACYRCHGEVPANGAPMSLTTWEDFQRRTIVRPKPLMYEAARMRIDGSRQPLMPPGGAITAADKKVLLDWLSSGAPAADSGGSCS